MRKLCNKHNIHSNVNDKVELLKDKLFEQVAVYEKRLLISENRIRFRRENMKFELNRKMFYRDLEGEGLKVNENIDHEETLRFWSEVWMCNVNPMSHETLVNKLNPIRIPIEMSEEKIKKTCGMFFAIPAKLESSRA